jgi:hypothetical protein
MRLEVTTRNLKSGVYDKNISYKQIYSREVYFES